MKNFDTRTYSINDFVEWDNNKQLELSPKFQRKNVWSDNARSYLMDTIVRGKPIPKVFIRQKINPKTKQSIREVVDGQQRLRTILSFIKDGFKISKKHNSQYGGLFYSQLSSINEDVDIQTNILNYEISVDLLVNLPDEEVLDIFGRLNSYAIVLNEQEKINANHFGPFKTLCDTLAHSLNDFWLKNKILTEQKILRMEDVSLVADLMVAATRGIRPKKFVKQAYSQFETEFTFDTDLLATRFNETIDCIKSIFNSNMSASEFRRIHIFYSLFCSIYHVKYGIENIDNEYRAINLENSARVKNALDKVEYIFSVEDLTTLLPVETEFLTDSRRATTDGPVRIRRSEFILEMIQNEA